MIMTGNAADSCSELGLASGTRVLLYMTTLSLKTLTITGKSEPYADDAFINEYGIRENAYFSCT